MLQRGILWQKPIIESSFPCRCYPGELCHNQNVLLISMYIIAPPIGGSMIHSQWQRVQAAFSLNIVHSSPTRSKIYSNKHANLHKKLWESDGHSQKIFLMLENNRILIYATASSSSPSHSVFHSACSGHWINFLSFPLEKGNPAIRFLIVQSRVGRRAASSFSISQMPS